jgi:hypothetical protein
LPRAARKRKGLDALPVPLSTRPMEARLVAELAREPGWQLKPKWDSFRCLAFRAGDEVELRAKSRRSRVTSPKYQDGDGVVSHASPSGVIAILFAAARVAPGSLNVSVWIGTNPYFGPRWRHRDRIDAREFVAIVYSVA